MEGLWKGKSHTPFAHFPLPISQPPFVETRRARAERTADNL